MGVLLMPGAGRRSRKAALRAACTPPSPLSRCAASSLTTPPHLRFVEVVRERGRRGAQRAWGDGRRQRQFRNQEAGQAAAAGSGLEVQKSSGLDGWTGRARRYGVWWIGRFVGAVSGL